MFGELEVHSIAIAHLERLDEAELVRKELMRRWPEFTFSWYVDQIPGKIGRIFFLRSRL